MQRFLTFVAAENPPTPPSSPEDTHAHPQIPPLPLLTATLEPTPNPSNAASNAASSPHSITLVPSPTPEQRLRKLLHHLATRSDVVFVLKELAETMVWADQHDVCLWETFLECNTMQTLVHCLRASTGGTKQSVHKSSSEPISTSVTTEAGSSVSTSAEDIRPNSSHPGKPLMNASSALEEAEAKRLARLREENALNQIIAVQAQILQTLSIMVQSVFRQESLLCLFSSNHINDILSFPFLFSNDEILAYYMSTVKTISLKLDCALLQLFFDPATNNFPLYSAVVPFLDHPERMVRIAVRNVTLSLYALGDESVLRYAAGDKSKYLQKTVDMLAKLCGSVARAFELLLDDGREIRRTRSRTGIFRRNVRISDVSAKLDEIENLFAYLSDVSEVSQQHLRPMILGLMTTRLFSPFFRPLSSQASPKAMQQQRRWRIKNSPVNIKPALPLFDAAARCLLLTSVLINCRNSRLGYSLLKELRRATPDFEGRTVLHALKSMASNISGTERVTFISLCAIEAVVRCDCVTKDDLAVLKYDLQMEEAEVVDEDRANLFLDIGIPDRDDLEGRGEQPMLMTLSEFEAPLTPSNSIPSTPTYGARSPDILSPGGLQRTFSHSSMSDVGDRMENDDGILWSFQLGEAGLREAISSVVLVVRRREVRTLRVMQAIVRIINAVGEKTNVLVCVDVIKMILDEVAGMMTSFLSNKRTTIVSLESMFEHFRSVAQNKEMYASTPLDKLICSDRCAYTASTFPKGAGKRRRGIGDDCIAPVEREDAVMLFVMLIAYEDCLKRCGYESNLLEETTGCLLEYGMDDSYLDKREALYMVARAILNHLVVD